LINVVNTAYTIEERAKLISDKVMRIVEKSGEKAHL
jgi:hypothetical protein